jgi:hypothetical protein
MAGAWPVKSKEFKEALRFVAVRHGGNRMRTCRNCSRFISLTLLLEQMGDSVKGNN